MINVLLLHHISALQDCNGTTITNYRLFTGHESGHINRVILLQGAGRWARAVGGGWSITSLHHAAVKPGPLDHFHCYVPEAP